jgi:hypothetical protein
VFSVSQCSVCALQPFPPRLTISLADTGLDHDSCFFRDGTRPVPVCAANASTANASAAAACRSSVHRKVAAYHAFGGQDPRRARDTAWGHGTHVAGTLAALAADADAARARWAADYDGVARGARLVIDDVSDSDGSRRTRTPRGGPGRLPRVTAHNSLNVTLDVTGLFERNGLVGSRSAGDDVNALPADLAHDLWPWSYAAGVLPARDKNFSALARGGSRASSFSGVFFSFAPPTWGELNSYIAVHSVAPTLPHSTGARIHSNSWNFDKVWTYDINAVRSFSV